MTIDSAGVANIAGRRLFGLLELDAEGTVLYSRTEDKEGNRPLDNFVGRNFYSGVARFKNIADFRGFLDRFARSQDQAGGFSFICEYADGDVPVKVLLARIRERAGNRRGYVVLMHIRKDV